MAPERSFLATSPQGDTLLISRSLGEFIRLSALLSQLTRSRSVSRSTTASSPTQDVRRLHILSPDRNVADTALKNLCSSWRKSSSLSKSAPALPRPPSLDSLPRSSFLRGRARRTFRRPSSASYEVSWTFADLVPFPAVGFRALDLCPFAHQHWRERSDDAQHHGVLVFRLRRHRSNSCRNVGVCSRKHVRRDRVLFLRRVSELRVQVAAFSAELTFVAYADSGCATVSSFLLGLELSLATRTTPNWQRRRGEQLPFRRFATSLTSLSPRSDSSCSAGPSSPSSSSALPSYAFPRLPHRRS